VTISGKLFSFFFPFAFGSHDTFRSERERKFKKKFVKEEIAAPEGKKSRMRERERERKEHEKDKKKKGKKKKRTNKLEPWLFPSLSRKRQITLKDRGGGKMPTGRGELEYGKCSMDNEWAKKRGGK
jgi:hypothetical protein